MNAAPHPPLYLLAVDHRRSFERLFGVAGPVDPDMRARLSAAKVTVVDALNAAVTERSGLDGAGLLECAGDGRSEVDVAGGGAGLLDEGATARC